MQNEKILFIEDEPDIQELVRFNLLKEGYSVECTDKGGDAVTRLRKSKADLVLLDLMLPDVNGIEVCKSIKSASRTSNVPVIMLTARKGEEAVIEGFNAGAVDYITKPFSIKELACRIKAILSLRNRKIPLKDSSINPYWLMHHYAKF